MNLTRPSPISAGSVMADGSTITDIFTSRLSVPMPAEIAARAALLANVLGMLDVVSYEIVELLARDEAKNGGQDS